MSDCKPISYTPQCPSIIAVPITITPALTGYTKITEFTFTPKLTGDFASYYHTGVSQVKVSWDFGDGYTLSASNSFQAKHQYKYPGNYTVNLYFYDNEGKALLNTLTQTISVNNFLTNKVKFPNKTTIYSAAGLLPQIDAAGNLPTWPKPGWQVDPIDFYLQVTWQDYNENGNNIFFAVSGSDSDLYDDTYKYSFLLPNRSFFTVDNNKLVRLKNNKHNVKLKPMRYILPTGSNTPVLTTNPNPVSASYILGASGSDRFFYYDDKPGRRKLFIAIDTSKHTIPDYFINNIDTDLNLTNLNYLESAVDSINVRIFQKRPTKLLLTSTGNQFMTLPKYKRQGDPFQVFVSVTDEVGSNMRNFDKFYYDNSGYDNNTVGRFKATVGNTLASSVTSTLISSVSSNDFPFNASLSSSELSSLFYLNYTPTVTGEQTIYVRGVPQNNIAELSGSYTFTVLPSGGTEFYKINELEFDYKETLKSYRFQSFLHDYDLLFNGLIGSIVGTLSSNPNSYGKVIFEKISNFVINNSDVDTCNIETLRKLYDLFNEEANFNITQAPPGLKRLFDLYTIRFRRLMGMDEKFDQSFNTYYTSNSAYGKNIDFNNPIDASTYTVTAYTDFVAEQKFSNEYIHIKPQKVSSGTITSGTTEISTYPLSAYNKKPGATWGWNLDSNVTGASGLKHYYNFYPYLENYNNKRKNNILDYTSHNHNSLTTSISSISTWNTEVYKNVDYQIRKGLNL